VNFGTNFPDLNTLAAVIAHSQIVVETPAAVRPLVDHPLPAGFGEADMVVLEWIAAEGRRFGHAISRH